MNPPTHSMILHDYMLNKGGDVALALTASGYRDNETRKLEITTIYDLSELGKSGLINRSHSG